MSNKKLSARLCGWFDEEMFKTIRILRNAGFKVSATPVSGPVELSYGSETYTGLKTIKEFVSNYQK